MEVRRDAHIGEMRSIFEYLAIFFAVLFVVKAQESAATGDTGQPEEEELGTTCPVLTTSTVGTTTTTAASEPNTICPENEGMNDALRNVTLDIHNTNRANIANGLQQMGGSTSMRKANNMPELDINCDLEKTALEEAQKCETTDDLIGREFNMKMMEGETDLEAALKSALEAWWKEIENPPVIDQIQNLFYDHQLKQHWSKMATDKTKKVGCAAAKCDDKGVRVVCKYEKILKNGEKIYNMGPTCKQCSAGAGMADCQAEPYAGLCPAKYFTS